MAEYIVASALGVKKSNNCDYWALYDVDYKNGNKNYRIEVKETSYYHPWNKNDKVSNQRTFGITKANSNYENEDIENKFERQNDIYVFCLVNGKNEKDADPLNLNNWQFYVVRTEVINKVCGDNKTISLGKVQQLAKKSVRYDELKEEVDREIANINK
ncbi:MAG: hypothetical protein E7262_10710 [Lachnospiraceae bacterium]|nr:hypothetical protein [Lachnospiraceae bacterium]